MKDDSTSLLRLMRTYLDRHAQRVTSTRPSWPLPVPLSSGEDAATCLIAVMGYLVDRPFGHSSASILMAVLRDHLQTLLAAVGSDRHLPAALKETGWHVSVERSLRSPDRHEAPSAVIDLWIDSTTASIVIADERNAAGLAAPIRRYRAYAEFARGGKPVYLFYVTRNVCSPACTARLTCGSFIDGWLTACIYQSGLPAELVATLRAYREMVRELRPACPSGSASPAD